MIRVNPHYSKLQASYLFSEIARKVSEFQAGNPDKDIIKLGIGDVTHGLPPACIEAMHKAVDEMAVDATFRGYGPEQGYDFLREAIALNDFASRGVTIQPDEIFISDGAKCDSGNIQEILAQDARIAVPDPVYPVYVDTNVMAGRTGKWKDGRYQGLVYLESTANNHYVPALPSEAVDAIYLCFPNNPTGATVTHDELKAWVEYAREHKSLILFDAAYEAFIRDESLPHSIYEVDGADEVAIEFRSFSKTAGFTGTRCAYTIVPKACRAYDAAGTVQDLHFLWNRRHTTKFNGVSYPVQRAAEAVFSPQGQEQIKALNDGYLHNAAHIRQQISTLGYDFVGGQNSPYIWINTGEDSWAFFDRLLNEAAVVTTPGAGFGACGEGYIRISAFNDFAKVEEAMQRIAAVLGR
ncbi:MAG: LL-diaminopimelate aminotransferase [Kiritimatiellia bacterium]|jgi:LL-diaminopimelate aminotransferase|nr:LL-diaminopimelate aminotransferase [Kiritimatiellia bacterium]MDP6810656.1 LL-diaminopimelate aminotransferase [Kiritimatiellia bacterium]MDP7023742.1 LL-diaminopimelate aminotransferase [Kiritimatiellia bacterium]